MQGQVKKTSFSDALEVNSDMRQDIVDYLFSNYTISSYEEFQDALFDYFDSPHGKNAMIDTDDAIRLFNHDEAKTKMKQNTTEKEYDEAYGDGNFVQREPVTKTKVVTISVPRIAVSPYNRQGRPIKPYSRGKSNPFTPAQMNFLQERKGRPPREVISQYNSHFVANPRTSSSITTKFYRLNKSGGSKSSDSYSQK
jgi:hypothetical protein